MDDRERFIVAQAFVAGREEGVKRSTRAFILGVVLGALAVVWTATALAQVPPQAEAYRRDLTRTAQSVWGMDAPVALLGAQIEQESAWNPQAVSPAGAMGLAQFMPRTAADMARRYDVGPANPFDPRWAMHAQSIYLRELHGLVGAVNESERYAFALAAYNGGLRHVWTRQDMSPAPGRCINATCDIRPPGVSASNQRQNRDYSRRVLLVLMPRYHAAGWGGPALHARYGGI